MATADATQPKWQNKSTADLKGPTPDQIWPFLADFCNIHKWMPFDFDTSYHVEGEQGKPGLIRYCAVSRPPSSDTGDETVVLWAKEKLLMINPFERCLSYEILDNNAGFKRYVATIKVLPVDGEDGCKIEWSFESDPVDRWSYEDLVSYINTCLQHMATKMEQAVLSAA